jgi:penicillin-binding protein 2
MPLRHWFRVANASRRVAFDAVDPLPLKREHVELVTRAMYGVTQEGTSVRSFIGAQYKTGGKTGTAQAVSIKANEKYNAAKLEEHQRDHSLYIAFAPLEVPTVALAVIIENAGFGSDAAAPIARRIFDYLLLGQVPSIEDMALTQQGKATTPVGKPRPAEDYALPGVAAAMPAEQRVAKGPR